MTDEQAADVDLTGDDRPSGEPAPLADRGFGFGPHGLPIRPTARVLVFDRDDRVLLFRFDDAAALGPEKVWWGTPGGGVDPGETVRQGAVRELFEETGLRVEPEALGPVVAWNEGAASFVGGGYWFLNRYFVARVDGFALDASGWEAVESGLITRHAWLTPAQLAELPEPVHPHGLRWLIAALHERGAPPREPVDVGPDQPGDEVAAAWSPAARPRVLRDGLTAAGLPPEPVRPV